MEVKKDQKLVISVKIRPEVANLQRLIIPHEKFDTVTCLGQITNFDTFWGTQRQMGVKKVKNCPSCEKLPQKKKICTDAGYFFHEKCSLFYPFWGTLGVKKGEILREETIYANLLSLCNNENFKQIKQEMLAHSRTLGKWVTVTNHIRDASKFLSRIAAYRNKKYRAVPTGSTRVASAIINI